MASTSNKDSTERVRGWFPRKAAVDVYVAEEMEKREQRKANANGSNSKKEK